jgi:hypothetical protein
MLMKLTKISSYLNGVDLLSLTHTNRFLYAILSVSRVLWKKVFVKEGFSPSRIIGNH